MITLRNCVQSFMEIRLSCPNIMLYTLDGLCFNRVNLPINRGDQSDIRQVNHFLFIGH